MNSKATKHLHLKNIRIRRAKNVRDIGGIPVEGGTVRHKMFIRSGNLSKIKPRYAKKLKEEYNLKIVVDLRNSAEKAEKPDKHIDGVTMYEMPIFDNSIPGISHESKNDLEHVPSMVELYAAVARGSSFNNLCVAVRKIIHLCDKDYSILYHCTEGKDRTGMVTALILTVLGADREVIFEDYLFTNKVNKKKAVGYYILINLVKWNRRAARLVYNVFLAREEYLNEVFKVIDEIGQEKFIDEYLKLSPHDIEHFRSLAVEPNE